MKSLELTKNQLGFLTAALSKDKTRPHLGHVIVTNDNKMCATDLYRLHVIPLEEQHEPGYYAVAKGSTTLYYAGREELDGTLWDHETNGFANLYPASAHPQRVIVSGLDVTPRVGLDLPKITKTGHYLTFREAALDDEGKESRAVCLGLNALPWMFLSDGTLGIDRRDDYLLVDALFMQDALAYGMVTPIMRWGDRRYGALLVGEQQYTHALVMPYHVDFWDIKNDFGLLRPRSGLKPPAWEIASAQPVAQAA